MNNYVITINRQFGSLGRPIARKMSEMLDIEYYDRDIVDSVAKEMDLPVSVVSDEEETAKSNYFSMKFPLGNGTTAMQQDIFEAQRRIISNLADRENCIIVGRCSDYILRNHPSPDPRLHLRAEGCPLQKLRGKSAHVPGSREKDDHRR